MRLVIFLALTACGSPASRAPRAEAKPQNITDPLVYCDLAVRMIDELAACTKAPAGSFETLRQSMHTERTGGPVLARKSGAYCAQGMELLLLDPERPKCTFTVAPRIAEITAFLDAYYAERTPVTPTGDARRDRALQQLAKHRDEVCACADHACASRVVDAFLAGSIEPVGGSAPEPVLELADRLLDEVSRCTSELRWTRRK